MARIVCIVMMALGVGLGFVIGGIGIAMMGTGFGIPVGVVMLGLALFLGRIGWRVGKALERTLS